MSYYHEHLMKGKVIGKSLTTHAHAHEGRNCAFQNKNKSDSTIPDSSEEAKGKKKEKLCISSYVYVFYVSTHTLDS